MADPTLFGWLGLATVSGVAAAVATNLLGAVRDILGYRAKRNSESASRQHERTQQAAQLAHAQKLQLEEREHQRILLQEQRNHERELRVEQEFFRARDDLLEPAHQVKDWIDYTWGAEFGLEVDYVQANRSAPALRGPADAVTTLRRIAALHPRQSIRNTAEELADSIDTTYNVPSTADFRIEATDKDFREWSTDIRRLQEQLHNPELA